MNAKLEISLLILTEQTHTLVQNELILPLVHIEPRTELMLLSEVVQLLLHLSLPLLLTHFLLGPFSLFLLLPLPALLSAMFLLCLFLLLGPLLLILLSPLLE